jgi:Tfp pilus assembly protein PilN
MIKINLLPQRRPKRAAGRRVGSDPSAKHILYGVIALAAAGLAVVFAVDRPLREDLERYGTEEQELRDDLKKKSAQLVGYAEMQKAQADAELRKKSIERLMRAKVVPAHVLHELGEILTAGHSPTMTKEMIEKTSNDKTGDPNKRFQQDWDPTHVWLSGYSDAGGVFKLEGGAQTENDVAQLSKRLAASAYFMDVTPSGGERVTDQASGINYVKFTITGKVAY